VNWFFELLDNKILWMSVLSWFTAQVIKTFLVLVRQKRFDARRLIGAGGMPSSHTAIVVTLMLNVGRECGFNSPYFAICTTLALIVMYDATGVRRAAGEQAKVINKIVVLMNNKEERIDYGKTLKELLGHKPIEVICGAILGILIGLI